MKEEDIIRKAAGSENPFRVPEGYFEDFTTRLMSQLPQTAQTQPAKQKHSISLRPHFLRYAAAAVVILAVGVTFFGTRPSHSSQSAENTQHLAQDASTETFAEMDYNDLDEALDYAMVDNMDITYYLTEAY